MDTTSGEWIMDFKDEYSYDVNGNQILNARYLWDTSSQQWIGKKRSADNTLVALTLMIAVSKPDEKDTMTKVIVNLINRNNNISYNFVSCLLYEVITDR